jgi:hypothetical protein
MQVTLDVVNGDEGYVERERQAAAKIEPYEQRAGQTGPLGRGHDTQLLQVDFGVAQGSRCDLRDRSDVLPAREFRNDSSIWRM